MSDTRSSIIIMRKDPEMPTQEFVKVLKARKAELAGETEAIDRLLAYHGDVAPPPPPPAKAKSKSVTPPEGKSAPPGTLDERFREQIRGYLSNGEAVKDIANKLGPTYGGQAVYNCAYRLKKKAEFEGAN